MILHLNVRTKVYYIYKYGCGYSAKMLEFRLKAIIV